ncbi:MAG: FHA domain-containing protein [Myxococcales bacterium]|nr:FHA domain-containing protein [Myxococcales bacterium]
MFTVVITEKGGEQRRLEFDKSEVNIGRVQGNDIILPKGNVSKRHSRVVRKDGKFIIVDLKSTNGTYVNGRKITSPLVIKSTDKIYIGDFILHVEDGPGAEMSAPGAEAPSASGGRRPPPPPPRHPATSRTSAIVARPRPTPRPDPAFRARRCAPIALAIRRLPRTDTPARVVRRSRPPNLPPRPPVART